MVSQRKKAVRKRAKDGDIHARMTLQALKQAEDEKAFLNLIRAQPMFFLRGVAEIRDLPFPSPQARQVILAGILGNQTIEQIAGLFGRSVEELRQHYADEIDHGPTAVVADAMTTAIGAAIMGDTKVLVPFLRARAGLVEPSGVPEQGEATPALLAEQSAALVGRILDLVDRSRRQDVAIDVTPKREGEK